MPARADSFTNAIESLRRDLEKRQTKPEFDVDLNDESEEDREQYWFIREEQLKQVLDDERVLLITSHLGLRPEDCDEVLQRDLFRQSLAVLVKLKYQDSFAELYRLLKEHNISDNNLPLPSVRLSQIWDDETVRSAFLRDQYAFCPHKLQLKTKAQRIGTTEPFVPLNPNARLPFVSKRQIGQGHFGKVFKVIVPAGYALTDNRPNQEDEEYVCKEFNDVEEGLLENDILKKLRSSEMTHEHILYSLGAYKHHRKATIVLHFMKFGNLQSFLFYENSTGTQALLTKDLIDNLQSSVSTHEYYRDPRVRADALDQMRKIAWALHALHDLVDDDESWAHKDIKPQNILIDEDCESKVGRWRLADFGLSRSTVRNVKVNDSSSTSDSPSDQAGIVFRTYCAPEEVSPNGRSSRKSDVWSLACIFLEVLTFLQGGHSAVREFSEQRSKDGTNGFSDTGFYFNGDLDQHANRLSKFDSSSQNALNPSSCIRSSVENQMQRLVQEFDASDHWLHESIKLLRRVFVERNDRLSSKQLHEMLRTVVKYFKDPKEYHRYRESRHSRLKSNDLDGHPISHTISHCPINPNNLVSFEGKETLTLFSEKSGRVPSMNSQTWTCAWLHGKHTVNFQRLRQCGDTIKLYPVGRFNCDPEHKWEGLHSAGPFTIAWGHRGKKSKSHEPPVVLFEILENTVQQVSLSNSPIPVQFQDTKVSCQGHLLFDKGTDGLEIVFLRTGKTHELTPMKGHHRFKDACFNDSCQLLYAWSCGNGDDQFYIWQVDEAQHAIKLLSQHGFETDHERVALSSYFSLLPLNMHTGCVVRKGADEPRFVALPDIEGGSSTVQSRFELDVKGRSSVCITSNDWLVYVRGKQVLVRELVPLSPGTGSEQPSKPLCHLQIEPTYYTVCTILEAGDKVFAVFCHAGGEIEIAQFSTI